MTVAELKEYLGGFQDTDLVQVLIFNEDPTLCNDVQIFQTTAIKYPVLRIDGLHAPADTKPFYINAINYFGQHIENSQEPVTVNSYTFYKVNIYGLYWNILDKNSNMAAGGTNLTYNEMIMCLHDILNYGIVKPGTIRKLNTGGNS